MYELEETHDYAPEGTVDGMVVENENVLILQDRDFEDADIDKLGEYIEESFKDLDTLTKLNSVVKEAIAEPVKATQWLLNHAQETRIQMARHYGGSVAMESFYTPSTVVFALEEEEKKEVGIIGRIVDSIVRAFKWLWKKITGVFSSKDPEKEEAKLDEAVASSEKAEEAGVKPAEVDQIAEASSDKKEVVAENKETMKKREPQIKKFSALLGRIDPPMSAAKLITYYKKLQDETQKLEAMVTATVSAYNLFEKTASQLTKENLKDAIPVFVNTIPEMLMAGASRFEGINGTIASPYFNHVDAESIAKAYRLEQLSWGKDLCVAQVSKDGGTVVLISYMALSKYEPKDVSKVNILSSTEQKDLSAAIKAFGKKMAALNETIAKVAAVAKDPNGLTRMVKVFDTLEVGDEALRKQIKEGVSGVASRLLSIVKTLANAGNELNSVHKLGLEWVKECSSILNELARNANKATKEAEKESE